LSRELISPPISPEVTDSGWSLPPDGGWRLPSRRSAVLSTWTLADLSPVDQELAAVEHRDAAVGLLLCADVHQLRKIRQGLVALVE